MTSSLCSTMTSSWSNPHLVVQESAMGVSDNHKKHKMPKNKNTYALFPLATMPETVMPREEKLEEMKGKIYLKKRDAEIFVEETNQMLGKNEKIIFTLREQNKKKRKRLSEGLSFDKHVIENAFENQKEDKLSKKHSTVDRVIYVMEHKVGKAKNRLNCMLYEATQRERKLAELENKLFRLITLEYRDLDKEQKKEFRRLENELEKSKIKYDASLNIKQRYEQILGHLKLECRTYPVKLSKMELEIEESERDLEEAMRMKKKAVKCWEQVNKDLYVREQQIIASKRLRDMKLGKARRDVDRQKDLLEAASRRVHEVEEIIESEVNICEQDGPTGYFAVKQSLIALEEAFDKLKRSINVADLQDVVEHVAKQDETTERLVAAKEDMMRRINNVREEHEREVNLLDSIKFANNKHDLQSREHMYEVLKFVKQEEERKLKNIQTMETKRKVKLQVEAGIETIYAKLDVVKIDLPLYIKNETPVENPNVFQYL
ncbi:outer dynein arm-docking complex subunit 3-like isoform X2 [Gigantopelta aegis]|uniref:outer dynein arm-docking complex subunit 3-like isoform X2 n=1 Tax=Gigantopelta aegis TaxID=1735272 RepID=UPI001B8883B6|nr:outer dynein arm-docking complex subunit 3-like isoform X2 [Gigantopelta aegis]